jgi:hypothetical protein
VKPFYTAGTIARSKGVDAKTIRLRARRERWQSRRQGNRVEYRVPFDLAKSLKGISPKLSLADQPRALRELLRAAAVASFILELRRNPRYGVERALAVTASNFRRVFKFSVRGLRYWVSAVEASGIAGLKEHKAGVVGRKSSRLERILT